MDMVQEASGTVWQDLAACLTEDPDLFFPASTREEGAALRQIEAAKAVCARCPVVEECLREALDNDEQGVWGGLSEGERLTLKRGRTRGVAA